MRGNKKGLSTVVTTIILVLLTIALVSIVWGVVHNIVTTNVNKAESCFNTFNKVTLNYFYTCFNSSSNESLFSINIKDIGVDAVLIAITAENGTSKSYTITNKDQNITGLSPYLSSLTSVKLPGKNAGRTYVSSEFSDTGKPSSIEIAPIINGEQCEVSDSSYEIGTC